MRARERATEICCSLSGRDSSRPPAGHGAEDFLCGAGVRRGGGVRRQQRPHERPSGGCSGSPRAFFFFFEELLVRFGRAIGAKETLGVLFGWWRLASDGEW